MRPMTDETPLLGSLIALRYIAEELATQQARQKRRRRDLTRLVRCNCENILALSRAVQQAVERLNRDSEAGEWWRNGPPEEEEEEPCSPCRHPWTPRTCHGPIGSRPPITRP